MSVEESASEVINKSVLKIGGDGGLIAVDALGKIGDRYALN